MIKLPEFANRCVVCKRREATLLCDKVLGEWQAIGHPPLSKRRYSGGFSAEDMSGTFTCDRELCEKCAIHITGMDLCPKCAKELKTALGRVKI